MVEIGLIDLAPIFRSFDLVWFKPGLHIVGYGAALPPAAQLQGLLSVGIGSEVKLIVFPLLKGIVQDLVDDPVDRKFRIDRRCFGRCSDFSKNQIFRINIEAAVQEDVLKRIGTLQFAWFPFVLLIGLGHQAQPL